MAQRNGKLVTKAIQYGYDKENAYTIENDDSVLKVKKGTEFGGLQAATPTKASASNNDVVTVEYMNDPANNEVYRAFKDFVDDYNIDGEDDDGTVTNESFNKTWKSLDKAHTEKSE